MSPSISPPLALAAPSIALVGTGERQGAAEAGVEAAAASPGVALGPDGREWVLFTGALAIVGALLGGMLYKSHQSIDTTERDRLHVQARVIGDNIGQQLEGMNRALASVRNDYLATARNGGVPLSPRLKALTEASPGMRSMVLLDTEGTVVASSVDALLGRDFTGRDYFRVPRAAGDAATLHVAAPYKTSLETYTVVFARAITGPNGSFAGVVAAALDPEYFGVLLRSVLYAPDMWVTLGHGDGQIFVTMPADAERLESKLQQALMALDARSGHAAASVLVGPIAAGPGGANVERMTALRHVEPALLHMDRPLVVSVSRTVAEVFGAWHQQATIGAALFLLLGAGTGFGLQRAQLRRRTGADREAGALRERQRTAEQLALALHGADLGLWDWDVRNDRFAHNETARNRLGYAPDEIGHLGDDWRRLAHPDDALAQIVALEAHLRAETPAYECEFRVRHRAGHWVWLLSRGKVVERDATGRPVRMTGTHMDLTERKRTQAEIERAAEMLRRTGQVAHVGGWELDVATNVVTWTEQVFRIHELALGAMPKLAEALDFYPVPVRPQIQAAIEAALRGAEYDLELPFVTARGRARWVRAQGVPVYEDGRVVRLIGAFQDITEKKTIALELQRLNEELVRHSTTDALTGIGNRRMFDQTLKSEWSRASRRKESLALLMIDIDHFKEYNDHYGHPAGDACLRQVARLVGASVRRGGELAARYGGEEFVVLLPRSDLAAARVVAERCLKAVADARIEHSASPGAHWLCVSIGTASLVAEAGAGSEKLVSAADAALYRAKRCGRSRIAD